MKEYISKDRAKQFVCGHCNEVCSEEPCEPSDCDWMAFIDKEPAADVVEVVRCKDCKHYAAMVTDTVSGELETATWGICTKPWFNSYEYDVHEDDYCSYSERKMDKEVADETERTN